MTSSSEPVLRGGTAGTVRPFLGAEVVDEDLRSRLERAAAEGYERGLAEGRRQGLDRLRLAADHLRGALEAAVEELRRMHRERAGEIAELSLAVAEFVVGELPHDGGRGLAVRIARALSEVEDEELTVAVHPDDLDVVSEAVAAEAGVRLLPDPAVPPGEGRIVGRWASVDLTREAAHEAARRALG